MMIRRLADTLARVLTVAALLILIAAPAFSLERLLESPEAPGLRLADTVVAKRLVEPVELDGKLDETVWERPSAAPMIQYDPECGHPPRQKTDWWVAYDDEALYVASRLWDSSPDSIVGRLGRRDTGPSSDWVYLNLDTFNDDRNAYSFSVNPAGAIGDSRLYNDGWGDPTWDGVWESATCIDEHGWTVEMRIPFSQLTFPNTEQQVWGINFSRRTLRYDGRDDIFYRPRGESGYCGRFPDLVGIENIAGGQRLEVLAYGVAKAQDVEVDPDNPFTDGSEFKGDAGLDLKWGLSSDLTLNATFNPDFGQVEVDPAVVNLSDMETYYQERRPFFVQDATIYNFGSEGTNSNWGFNWGDPGPFYSRRIGRSPQLWPDADHSDRPDGTAILGAGKLSGQIGGMSVGLMNATTSEERADINLDGENSRQTVEPLTNYTVLRMKHERDGGKGMFGLMATGVARDLNSDLGREKLASNAYTLGFDGWTYLDDDEVWALKGYFTSTHIRGSEEAIDRLQTSSRHYMDRMDADHIDYDPGRNSLTGWGGRLMLNKQKGDWRINTAAGAISPEYDVNDMGFHWRSDLINTHFALSRRWTEPNKIFRNVFLSSARWNSWDFGGVESGQGWYNMLDATLANYWNVWGHFSYNPRHNSTTALRGGPNVTLPSSRSMELGIGSDYRKPVRVEAWGSYWNTRGNGRGASAGLNLSARPSSALRLEFGPRYTWNQEQLQWIDAVEDDLMIATGGARYIFSDMEYREFSLSTRIDWTFSPTLSLQSYIQPLIASGHYSEFKEFARPSSSDWDLYGRDNGSTIVYDAGNGQYVVDPDGAGGAEAFELDDPDFSWRTLKVNMVLRWEYTPGSTMYLVWTQDRADFDDPGSFDIGGGTRKLLDAPGDDIFMLKITRWLDI